MTKALEHEVLSLRRVRIVGFGDVRFRSFEMLGFGASGFGAKGVGALCPKPKILQHFRGFSTHS